MQMQKAKEPDVAEFISALAAGNNAQLMVVACAGAADSNMLALVAAAHQTGGRVVCILHGFEDLHLSREVLGLDACHVEFVIGEAQKLVSTRYREADFVLIDCNLEDQEGIFEAVKGVRKQSGAIVVGFNALCNGSWWSSRSRTQFLPIGEGLLVTRVAAEPKISSSCGIGKSHWVVKVDRFTGEEHVFRVRAPRGKVIKS